MHELLSISAAALARAIQTKKVSVKEVVETHLQRLAEVNPALNAVVQLASDRALDEARVADLALLKGERLDRCTGCP